MIEPDSSIIKFELTGREEPELKHDNMKSEDEEENTKNTSRKDTKYKDRFGNRRLRKNFF